VNRADPLPRPVSRRLFGTDGVRGVANVEPVTAETALRLGRAAAEVCLRQAAGRPRIVVGKDTRWSGDMLESALAAGLCSRGADVLLTGPLPTPAIAFLTRELQAAAGAVISASHNPFADNGIKFFGPDGFKLPDEVEAEIEEHVLEPDDSAVPATGSQLGRILPLADGVERYAQFVRRTLIAPLTLSGLKLVVDCAHGAAYQVGPRLFRELGAEVLVLGADPDGININQGCGAVHPEALQAKVIAERAYLGVAFDGDADRVMFVDETGSVVDGDEALAIMAADMLSRGTLRYGTVVGTVMSNLGLELALRDRGVRLARTRVGDRYVVEEMRHYDYNLGGEQSGHLVFMDQTTTGDGLIAALQLLQVLVRQQSRLSQLKQVMTKLPQVLLNVPVARRAELESLPGVSRTVNRITGALGDRGRVVVRYSGTEPLVRVMVEGEQADQVGAYAEEIAAAIRLELTA